MIYVSSACVANGTIAESVTELAEFGFRNIELSGGTQYYEGYIDDLIEAKEKYNLNYLVHNYFPPPSQSFVLNLASLDETIFAQSVSHCKRAIDTCRILGSPAYGVHAGFFINITVSEIGKKLSKDKLYDKAACTARFCEAYLELLQYAGNDVKLYIENNVISKANYDTFDKVNPLMCTDVDTIKDLKGKLDFDLILDVAHLKVSCNTLGLDFWEQLVNLFATTDYIHLSDNDGSKDNNRSIRKDSTLLTQLRQLKFTDQTMVLEIYDSLESIKESFELIQSLNYAGQTNM